MRVCLGVLRALAAAATRRVVSAGAKRKAGGGKPGGGKAGGAKGKGKGPKKCPRKQPARVLTIKNMNPRILKVEYAVRGPVVLRAGEIEDELAQGEDKPFTHTVRANIGDGQAMGQQPISYIRQVLACLCNPYMMNEYPFPDDVKKRACALLSEAPGNSIGSYSMSQGITMIRKNVARYICKRDGIPTDFNNVFLAVGASGAIKSILQLFVKPGKLPTGIMVPVPQYPLYSATLAEYGLAQVSYYLDEDNNWALDECELRKVIKATKGKVNVRGIVVINPGNPTGQVLTRENIQAVIKFAYKNKLMIFADEVYQHNVYDKCSKFYSFKKVMQEMGDPYCNMELASFMSVSKGYMGECGFRGGYGELVNFDPKVKAQLYKAQSVSLCPPVIGQCIVDCVVRPPAEDEESYEQWCEEKDCVLGSLKKRAELIHDTFNTMEGFKCQPVQGAMYAFPRFELPPKAIAAAKKAGKPADVFYVFKLLEKTGIVVVPGSGFGQKPGTYHFRTTILPPTKMLKDMLEKFREFHHDFTKEYK